MATNIQEGDKVVCKRGNIDNDRGAGLVGTVAGFARFSSYHAREVNVFFGTHATLDPHPADGWFWLFDVVPAEQVKI